MGALAGDIHIDPRRGTARAVRRDR